MELRVGEMAKRSGLSIRTLHHYDGIGLLSPSGRSEGGARLYGREDFLRLHRIQVLKQIGYSLSDIRRLLDDTAADALSTILQQIELLDEQAKRARDLSDKLKYMSKRLSAGTNLEAADWLSLLEITSIYERNLTKAEVQLLRAPTTGEAHDIEALRSRLVAEVGGCMHRSEPTDSPQARELAWQWVRMVIALTSNDAALAGKLKALQVHNKRAQEIVGIDARMLEWIGEAIVHARIHLFSKYMSAAQTANLRRRQLDYMDEWPALVGLVREQMDIGTRCDAPPMRSLAERWRQLFRDSYCGDDDELEACVRRALSQEPDLSLGVGVDDELMRYIGMAITAMERAST
jgi:DNA-binding transcriptional MerR regulator